jgi:hypothetical protein
MHAEFTTIRTADILDALCEAHDAAVVRAGGDECRKNAIATAWGWLLQQGAVSYDPDAQALHSESTSEPGKACAANGDCQCQAFAQHTACWRLAATWLVCRALETRADTERHALAAELVTEAHEAGCHWYSVREGLEGARARYDEVMQFAAEWDINAEQMRAAAAESVQLSTGMTLGQTW